MCQCKDFKAIMSNVVLEFGRQAFSMYFQKNKELSGFLIFQLFFVVTEQTWRVWSRYRPVGAGRTAEAGAGRGRVVRGPRAAARAARSAWCARSRSSRATCSACGPACAPPCASPTASRASSCRRVRTLTTAYP